MEIVIRIVLIIAVLRLVQYIASKENSKVSSDSDIKLPKVYLIVGIAGLIFFAVIIVALIITSDTPMETVISVLILCPLMLFPVSIVVAYYNWGIELLENEFVYRTFFKKTYKFRYNDAWIKNSKPGEILVIAKGKKLHVDTHARNVQAFIQKIEGNRASSM